MRLFFFNDTATTEIYTLSLHDALPISAQESLRLAQLRHGPERALAPRERRASGRRGPHRALLRGLGYERSEEHTSELQSRLHLVCRLLLEKKKETTKTSAL